MPNEHLIGTIRAAIEWAALGIEILGAVVIVAGVLRVALTRGRVRFLLKLDQPGAYESYKHQMGRSLLLGSDAHETTRKSFSSRRDSPRRVPRTASITQTPTVTVRERLTDRRLISIAAGPAL